MQQARFALLSPVVSMASPDGCIATDGLANVRRMLCEPYSIDAAGEPQGLLRTLFEIAAHSYEPMAAKARQYLQTLRSLAANKVIYENGRYVVECEGLEQLFMTRSSRDAMRFVKAWACFHRPPPRPK
jgi:hypothetical protein